MGQVRLCEVDGSGVIARCFWGVSSQAVEPVRIAPEPWAVEGAHYDTAKQAHESYVGSEQQKSDLAQRDFEANKVYRTLFEYIFLLTNEVRALKGDNPITRVQLRNSMIDFYKSL